MHVDIILPYYTSEELKNLNYSRKKYIEMILIFNLLLKWFKEKMTC